MELHSPTGSKPNPLNGTSELVKALLEGKTIKKILLTDKYYLKHGVKKFTNFTGTDYWVDLQVKPDGTQLDYVEGVGNRLQDNNVPCSFYLTWVAYFEI